MVFGFQNEGMSLLGTLLTVKKLPCGVPIQTTASSVISLRLNVHVTIQKKILTVSYHILPSGSAVILSC
jgi:hypothetical protein